MHASECCGDGESRLKAGGWPLREIKTPLPLHEWFLARWSLTRCVARPHNLEGKRDKHSHPLHEGSTLVSEGKTH
jgi:hypothetical protein